MTDTAGETVTHEPLVHEVPKMDTPKGLYRGGCTCGWRSQGLETQNRAKKSAQQHCDAKNTSAAKPLSSPDWTLADVKAHLALLGAQVNPGADLQHYERPKGPAPMIAVDRVADVQGKPDYCVHGFCTCVMCDEFCYLGSETSKVVSERRAYPVCLPCARQHIPPENVPNDRVVDRKRSEGPHEHPHHHGFGF